MTSKDDITPDYSAFPLFRVDSWGHSEIKGGLTKREYLAAAALPAAMALNISLMNNGMGSYSTEALAKFSFAIADEMIRESEK